MYIHNRIKEVYPLKYNNLIYGQIVKTPLNSDRQQSLLEFVVQMWLYHKVLLLIEMLFQCSSVTQSINKITITFKITEQQQTYFYLESHSNIHDFIQSTCPQYLVIGGHLLNPLRTICEVLRQHVLYGCTHSQPISTGLKYAPCIAL